MKETMIDKMPPWGSGIWPDCKCGHDMESHTNHTHMVGTAAPTHCSQCDGECNAYRPVNLPQSPPVWLQKPNVVGEWEYEHGNEIGDVFVLPQGEFCVQWRISGVINRIDDCSGRWRLVVPILPMFDKATCEAVANRRRLLGAISADYIESLAGLPLR